MTAYQTVMNLINEYLNEENTEEISDKFCDKYMEMFFALSDKLEKELSQKHFEILDDLNLVCDSYEKNPDIRKADQYCIDEITLREKVVSYIGMIQQ